jgi:hypothetical protein
MAAISLCKVQQIWEQLVGYGRWGNRPREAQSRPLLESGRLYRRKYGKWGHRPWDTKKTPAGIIQREPYLLLYHLRPFGAVLCRCRGYSLWIFNLRFGLRAFKPGFQCLHVLQKRLGLLYFITQWLQFIFA